MEVLVWPFFAAMFYGIYKLYMVTFIKPLRPPPPFTLTFPITNGKMTVIGTDIHLVFNDGKICDLALTDIVKLELLQEQGMDIAHSMTGGVLGAVVGGPAGAAAGISAGRMLRECIFIIEFTGGKPVAAKGLYKAYEALVIHHRLNK